MQFKAKILLLIIQNMLFRSTMFLFIHLFFLIYNLSVEFAKNLSTNSSENIAINAIHL